MVRNHSSQTESIKVFMLDTMSGSSSVSLILNNSRSSILVTYTVFGAVSLLVKQKEFEVFADGPLTYYLTINFKLLTVPARIATLPL